MSQIAFKQEREKVKEWRRYPAYKDSGVEWLGEVPQHWEVKRLKYISRLVYGDSLSGDIREDGNIPVYGSNGAVGTHTIPNTFAPCIIVGRKGSYGKIIYSESCGFAIDTTYFIDRRTTISNVSLRWLFYVLSLLELDKSSQDTGVPGLSREFAHNQILPLPGFIQQQAIAQFLDRETAKIDTLIAKTRNSIEKLKEYRTAVISAALTGKIDVRND